MLLLMVLRAPRTRSAAAAGRLLLLAAECIEAALQRVASPSRTAIALLISLLRRGLGAPRGRACSGVSGARFEQMGALACFALRGGFARRARLEGTLRSTW